MKSLWSALVLICSLPFVAGPVSAQEYFGAFSGNAVGEFIAGTTPAEYELREQLVFTDPNGFDWPVPVGARVNGASIPSLFWTFIGSPFDTKYIRASVIHDHYCDMKNRTTHETNRAFYYGLRTDGVDPATANQMLWAVETFGPKWIIEQRQVSREVCVQSGGTDVCETVTESVPFPVLQPQIDLADPVIRSLAEAKFASISRTLLQSDGAILDIGPNGWVDSSVPTIEANAEFVRGILLSKDPAAISDNIGALSGWDGTVGVVTTGKGMMKYQDLQNLDAWQSNEARASYFKLSPEDIQGFESLPMTSMPNG